MFVRRRYRYHVVAGCADDFSQADFVLQNGFLQSIAGKEPVNGYGIALAHFNVANCSLKWQRIVVFLHLRWNATFQRWNTLIASIFYETEKKTIDYLFNRPRMLFLIMVWEFLQQLQDLSHRILYFGPRLLGTIQTTLIYQPLNRVEDSLALALHTVQLFRLR
jgi:hypothetical protein